MYQLRFRSTYTTLKVVYERDRSLPSDRNLFNQFYLALQQNLSVSALELALKRSLIAYWEELRGLRRNGQTFRQQVNGKQSSENFWHRKTFASTFDEGKLVLFHNKQKFWLRAEMFSFRTKWEHCALFIHVVC